MQKAIYCLLIVCYLSGCNKNEEGGPYYLKVAAEHCDCRQSKLNWLQTIVNSGGYPTPGAQLPAPIRQISLSTFGNEPIVLLDSDINACSYCPWAILDCKGKPLLAKLSSFPTRDKIIWERYEEDSGIKKLR